MWVSLGWGQGRSRGCAVSPSISRQSPLFFFFFATTCSNYGQSQPICGLDYQSLGGAFGPPFIFAQYCMYVFIQGRAREVLVRLDRKNGALQQESSKLYRASHQQALAALARARKCCRRKICRHSSEASSEEWRGFST